MRSLHRMRRRLNRAAESSVGQKLDAQDVLQSVFRAFFRRGAPETCRIGNSGPGWQLLVKIMPVEPRANNRHQTTEKRGTVAEAFEPPEGSSNQARARVTTRDQAAVVAEFEAALHGLPLIYCRILDLRLHGWSASKIARRLGTSRQTVYRVLDLLRQRLKDAPPVLPEIRNASVRVSRVGTMTQTGEGRNFLPREHAMAAKVKLADLPGADRQVIEAWLVEFELAWDPDLLKSRVSGLDQVPLEKWLRLPALIEMIKIDLERQWRHGRQISLDSYLHSYPELGGPDQVDAELIVAEYRVRHQFGAGVDLHTYATRYPNQAVEVRRLAVLDPSSAGSAASRFVQSVTTPHFGSRASRNRSDQSSAPAPTEFGADPCAEPATEAASAEQLTGQFEPPPTVPIASEVTRQIHLPGDTQLSSPSHEARWVPAISRDASITRCHPDSSDDDSSGSLEVGTVFDNYELLEELGRGGMGVVYKAREIGLNRIVALKMILSGEFAGPSLIQRFRTEAATAALFEHPGIVPIYRIGLARGQHFYTMGFVEGKSLSQRVAAGPLPPAEAAELVQQVAEAIDHAHAHQVIHRDLKPANILIDAAASRG